MFTVKLVAVGTAVASLLMTPALAQASAPQDAAVPPAGEVAIDIVTINGSGCPAGTADAGISSDNTAFRITYSGYVAAAGAGTRPTDFRKNCQLNLAIHVPDGFTYALERVDYAGQLFLADGASALQRSNFYFQGSSQDNVVTHTFTPDQNGDWRTTDVRDLGSEEFAPCGGQRNLNINTELRVNAGTSDPSTTASVITMDSTESDVFGLVWRQC